MAQEANTNDMDVDTGGAVAARDTCPHVLESLSMPDTLDGFPDLSLSTECNIDKCTHTESWVCMKCHAVLCGRYGDQHMIKHKNEQKTHCIAMGCGDLSFWCYGCDDYLDHLRLRRVFEFYKIAHVRKFNHEIHNLEKLMQRTNFANQDNLEKEQQENKQNDTAVAEPIWCKGTEILSRKWQKKDAIEYDSDPEHKKNDNKSHVHKGIILNVSPTKGSYGKIMVKDDTGGYGNYGLDEINIKLPPPTDENTVKREIKPNNRMSDLYSVNTTNTTRTTTGMGMGHKSYNLNKYRGYDENDSYKPPVEYVSFNKLQYRKKNWSVGDNIEYDSDPQHEDTIEQNHIRKGIITSIDMKQKAFKVKLSTGHTVQVNMNKIKIGVNKLFWCCQMCGFNNGYKTKQCMVCDMHEIEITQKSKRPQQEEKEEKKDNDNDVVMGDKKDENISEKVERFFVYGTLRDDDDSGALWTGQWTSGCNAMNGKLMGYKMYKNKNLNYPFAIKSNNDKDFIVGRIISFNDSKIFEEKKKGADRIEGYRDTNTNSLFHREIVKVENVNDGSKLKALFYFQDAPKDLDTTCDEIPNGDWLQRKR